MRIFFLMDRDTHLFFFYLKRGFALQKPIIHMMFNYNVAGAAMMRIKVLIQYPAPSLWLSGAKSHAMR